MLTHVTNHIHPEVSVLFNQIETFRRREGCLAADFMKWTLIVFYRFAHFNILNGKMKISIVQFKRKMVERWNEE